MAHSQFDADKVGICVSTLHPNPPAFTTDDIERLTHAAAKAGFPSIALQSYWVTRYGVEPMQRLLNAEGVAAGALEGAIHWHLGAAGGQKDADLLLDLTSGIGAKVLHGACMDTKIDSLAQAVEGLGVLCERARGYGVNVCIEPIPWYAIADLETGWEVVRQVNADNCGLCIDFQHIDAERGGANLNLLSNIPGKHISYMQLTDAPKSKADSAQSYLAECMVERLPMGEGAIDVDAMLAAVRATGASPYIVFQVCSPRLANEGADTMAARLRANAAARFS